MALATAPAQPFDEPVLAQISRGRALLRKRLVQVARSYGIGKSVQGDK
jgi:hypothetical protein